MTEAEKALEAYDKYITYLWGETLEKLVTSQEISERDETIRKALRGVAKTQDLIKAMTKIQTVSAHMQSKRSYELNKIATDALKNFNSDETGVGL